MSPKYTEQVAGLVTPDMKEWVREHTDGFPFESEGALLRVALEAMRKRGPIKTMEFVQEGENDSD